MGYLSAELRPDTEVGLAAVAQNPLVIQHVSDELRFELTELGECWGSDMCTVACAEIRRAMQGLSKQCKARYKVNKSNADQCKSIQHKGMHSNAMFAREISKSTSHSTS